MSDTPRKHVSLAEGGMFTAADLTWKAQGDANEYVLLLKDDPNHWVAAIRFNGELYPNQQEMLITSMLFEDSIHNPNPEPKSTPKEFLAHALLTKRSHDLGRPLTWKEAIELTYLLTDMTEEARDELLALDDPAPNAV